MLTNPQNTYIHHVGAEDDSHTTCEIYSINTETILNQIQMLQTSSPTEPLRYVLLDIH